jgi:hypothetical protein
MAPRKSKQGAAMPDIPPIDPNSQLNFCGNYASVISETDLFHLVEVGVLLPKELCSWRIWRGITVSMEDTHEAVIFIPFCNTLDIYLLSNCAYELKHVISLRIIVSMS